MTSLTCPESYKPFFHTGTSCEYEIYKLHTQNKRSSKKFMAMVDDELKKRNLKESDILSQGVPGYITLIQNRLDFLVTTTLLLNQLPQ